MIRAVLLPRQAGQAADYLLIDPESRQLVERGVLPVGPDQRPAPAETVVIAPGEAVLARWLELPARTEAQARAAAAILIRDLVADDAASGHLALGPRGDDDSRLAVVVDPAIVRGWLEQCAGLGIAPDALVPDHLVTPVPTGAGGALAIRYGEHLAVRAERLAMTCEADLAPVILGERPIAELRDQRQIEAAFLAAALAPPVNLLQGAFATRRAAAPGAWRPLALAAAAVAIAALSVPAVESVRKQRLPGRSKPCWRKRRPSWRQRPQAAIPWPRCGCCRRKTGRVGRVSGPPRPHCSRRLSARRRCVSIR